MYKEKNEKKGGVRNLFVVPSFLWGLFYKELSYTLKKKK